jgi:hypothetical protein
MPLFTPEESPYRFVAMVPQNVTERLLVEELGRKGGAVEYETTFVSAVQHDEHVSITLSYGAICERLRRNLDDLIQPDLPRASFISYLTALA